MDITEGKIIGIDLGTTNSLVAYVEGMEPVIIPNAEGSNKTPSVVAFMNTGEVIVGEIARRQAPTNPKCTVTSIKRLIGKTYSDLNKDNEKTVYKITEKDDQILIDINGMGYTPGQISAMIIQKLKESAEAYLGESVTQAIITVPAYFDDRQRNATIEAANLAGLEVLRLVNEPTAAAMAYGLGKEIEEIVAVYDFGGGTFDISVLEIDNNTFEVLVSNGDTHLGGDDLDNALVNMLIEEFNKKHGIDLSKDVVTFYRLKEVAEKAKCELSTTTHTLISLPFVAYKDKTPVHLERTIRRSEFEELIQEYVDNTIACTKEALKDARLGIKDISKVILVGGSSRIPLVQDEVEDFFGITPFKGVNPDEIVALGSATQAGIFAGKLAEVVLLDVTPHSLGVEIKNGKVSCIIEKNSTIPIKAAKTFTTTEDNQTFVNIPVVQGDNEYAADNTSLGKFTLSEIDGASAGIPRIRITFFINADGVVEISANDLASGREKNLTITHSFLSGEEQKSRKKRKKRKISKIKSSRRSGRKKTGILAGVQLPQAPEPDGDIDLPDDSHEDFQILKDGTQQGTIPYEAPLYTPSFAEYRQPPIQNEPLQKKPDDQETSPKEEIHKESTVFIKSKDQADFDKIQKDQTEIIKPEEEPAIENYETTDREKNELVKDASVTLFPELPLDEEILKKINKFLLMENKSEEALVLYSEFCEILGNLIAEGSSLPNHTYLSLSNLHTLSRFPEESRNAVKTYLKTPEADNIKALNALNFLLKYFPKYNLALQERAEILQKIGMLKDAIKCFEEIQKSGSDTDSINRLQNIYKEFLKKEQNPVIEFKLVKIYLKKGKLDESINLLQRLVQNKSFKFRALKILGLTYWQKNMYSLAWHSFKLLPKSNELTDILFRLSTDVEKVGDLSVAKDIYQRIMEDSPDYKDATAKFKKIEYRLQLQQKEAEKAKGAPILENSRFDIIEEVNRGSMGVIYKAQDKIVDDIVAVKLLNDYLCQDPKAVERFKSEARAAKKLSHPYIVRIHDMFESKNKLFISMEYIEGTDIKNMMKNGIKFTEETIVQYFLQICDALGYAHSLGVIHRDIKPANIMITLFNTIKITDFGIAKILKSDAVTKSGTAVIGTPLYMAPEQILGERVDARTDIYALGIMLYELFNGKPPFCEGNIEYHHVHTAPKEINAEITDKFRAVIMKMINKKPEDRFQSVQEIFIAVKGKGNK
jgi:molecular chaperone DnaK